MGMPHCRTCGLPIKILPLPGATCTECGAELEPGAFPASPSGRVKKPSWTDNQLVRLLIPIVLITPLVIAASVQNMPSGTLPPPPPIERRTWDPMRDRAHELAREKKPKLAAEQFKLALGQAQAMRSDDVMRIYREMAQLYRDNGMLRDLIPLWTDAVAYYEVVAGDEPYRLAQSWQDLSCAHVDNDDLAKALETAQRADALYRQSKHRYAKMNHDQLLKNLESIRTGLAKKK